MSSIAQAALIAFAPSPLRQPAARAEVLRAAFEAMAGRRLDVGG